MSENLTRPQKKSALEGIVFNKFLKSAVNSTLTNTSRLCFVQNNLLVTKNKQVHKKQGSQILIDIICVAIITSETSFKFYSHFFGIKSNWSSLPPRCSLSNSYTAFYQHALGRYHIWNSHSQWQKQTDRHKKKVDRYNTILLLMKNSPALYQ